MLMDVSGCVWQVISEFVEMCTCVPFLERFSILYRQGPGTRRLVLCE